MTASMSPLVRDASQKLMMTARQVVTLRASAPEILIEQLRERAREVKVTAPELSVELELLVNASFALHRNQAMPCAFDLLEAAHRLCAGVFPREAAQVTPEAPEAQPSFWWQKD